MALDATVGGASANSYVTLTEANAYFADRLHNEDWEDLDDKNQALITACSMLEWYMGGDWKGTKATTTQALAWPRTDVEDDDGNDVDDATIPSQVKVANYELALSIATEDRTDDWDLAGIKQLEAGSLMIETDSSGKNPNSDAIPEKILKILSPLITRSSSSVGIVRLVRA